MRQLEQILDTRLFERTPDGPRLTPAGQNLLPMAQRMADAATDIDRRQMALADHAGGVVRVAAGEWAARFLAPRLASLADTDRDLTVPDLDLEAIRAGAGLGILPCFVGDADPALVRLTAPIAELGADVWLLVHPDLRTVSRVRLLIDWIRSAFKEGRRVLRGLRVR